MTALCAVRCQQRPPRFLNISSSLSPFVRVPFSHEVNLNCISEFPQCHRRRRPPNWLAVRPNAAVILASREHCSFATVILPHQMADARAEPRTNGQNAVRHAGLTYSTSLSRKRSGPCLVSPVASARAKLRLRLIEGGRTNSGLASHPLRVMACLRSGPGGATKNTKKI